MNGNIATIIDMPSRKNTKGMFTTAQIEIDKFLEVPPVFCQREVDFRKTKTKKMLIKKFFLSHLDVAIFRYPDGREVVGNGNTRAQCWRECIDAGQDLENIPTHVNVTYYDVKNDDEAKGLYYTFDSDESVEKGPDKITGTFKSLGLSFNTVKLAKGTFGKSISYATLGRDSNPTHSKSVDYFEIVKDFKEELTALDSLNIKKHWDAAMICAALMMFKRHGVGNVRLISGFNQFNEERKNASSKKEGADGITSILEEYDSKRIFEQRGTDGITFPRVLDFLICCLEKHMEDPTKQFNYRRPSEGRGKGKRQNCFETFWDQNIFLDK